MIDSFFFQIGYREIKNQTVIPTFPMFPIVPYGHYLFTMAITDGEEVVGVNVSEAEVRPKV